MLPRTGWKWVRIAARSRARVAALAGFRGEPLVRPGRKGQMAGRRSLEETASHVRLRSGEPSRRVGLRREAVRCSDLVSELVGVAGLVAPRRKTADSAELATTHGKVLLDDGRFGTQAPQSSPLVEVDRALAKRAATVNAQIISVKAPFEANVKQLAADPAGSGAIGADRKVTGGPSGWAH